MKEYKDIQLSLLKPNKWNPNVMDVDIFLALKRNLYTSNGNKDHPILVRPINGYYEIIDGEHRYKALKELGINSAVCLIEDLDDKTARLRTIIMDNVHGKFNNAKLGELLNSLNKTYSIPFEEIERITGIDREKIDDCVNLVSANFKEMDDELFLGGGFNKDEDVVQAEFSGTIDIPMNKKQAELVKEAINKAKRIYPTASDSSLFIFMAKLLLEKKDTINFELLKSNASEYFLDPTNQEIERYIDFEV